MQLGGKTILGAIVMDRQLFPILVFILALCVTSCTSSLVYSPTINLPTEPLKQHQVEANGGILYLPETRPHRADRNMSFGFDGLLRYGLTDRVSLQAKGWRALKDLRGDSRSGFSLGSLVTLSAPSSTWQYGLIGQGGFVLWNSDIEGGGGSLSVVTWAPQFHSMKPYAGLGFIVGRRNSNSGNSDSFEWGWAITNNLGLNTTFSKHFGLNIELVTLYTKNEYDNYTKFLISPSLGLFAKF